MTASQHSPVSPMCAWEVPGDRPVDRPTADDEDIGLAENASGRSNSMIEFSVLVRSK